MNRLLKQYHKATKAVKLARKRRDGTIRGHERRQRKAMLELLRAGV